VVYPYGKVKFNPYWQILENPSKYFSKISVFSGGKWLDEFSRNRSDSSPELKFCENIRTSFPGFANKGRTTPVGTTNEIISKVMVPALTLIVPFETLIE